MFYYVASAPLANTSLAAKGALANRLQRRTACKIQNGRQGAPKWQRGSLPAVDRPNADRWNAARSRQLSHGTKIRYLSQFSTNCPHCFSVIKGLSHLIFRQGKLHHLFTSLKTLLTFREQMGPSVARKILDNLWLNRP